MEIETEIGTEAICQVCVHHCHLRPGQWGICRARKNEDGRIVCKNYGRLTSLALDPIEKKPLYRFYPGSNILSVGSFGCNLRCPFCQNYEISMAGEESRTRFFSPEDVVQVALECKSEGNIGVAFTYNEPLVGWEFVVDTAKLVKEQGMQTVLVTNGTAEPDILKELLPYIDAMNIDLKGFREDYYRMVGGDLEAVKASIVSAVKYGCHVELTTLIVPSENDAPEEMEQEVAWIASVDRGIPLHITRFFPRYRMQDRNATEVDRLFHLADIARRYLKDVFVGNV